MKIRDMFAKGVKKFNAVCHELKQFETNDSACFMVNNDELGCYVIFDTDVEDLNGHKMFTGGKSYSINLSKLEWDIEVIPDKYLEG